MKQAFSLRYGIALILLSASVIASQITLMQILTIEQWHHFAFMVISIALLGFGAAGTVISIFRKTILKHKNILLPLFAIVAGFCLGPVHRLAATKLLAFDLYLLFIDSSQFWKLTANLIIYFLPFFFAALIIGILFTEYVADIGKLYFMNLIGSGIGALLALPVLNSMFPWEAKSLFAFFAVVSGLLFIKKVKPAYASLISLLALSFVIISWALPYKLNISQYKSFSKSLHLPDATMIYEKPDIFGLTQVLTSPALRYAPGISLSFGGDVPVLPAVFINGDFTGVLNNNRDRNSHPANYSTFALPYSICKPDSVLVLNAGTGYLVDQALQNEAYKIDVTEPNKALVEMMRTVFSEESGMLYNHENACVHTIDSRTFISSTKQKYDLIILPVLDAFGGVSGLYAMQENYILTIEGFNQMWNALSPDGCITVSSWLDYPVRTPLKICTTLIQMLKDNNISDPKQHIAMIKSWSTTTFVVTKSPLNEQQINAARLFCDSLYFDPVILPGINYDERNKYNTFNDPTLFSLIDSITADSKAYRQYEFFIEPSTDNCPYFNHFFRLKTLPVLRNLYNNQTLPFLELGYLIVIVSLLQVTLLSLLFILLPLFRLKFSGKRKMPVLIYFASLGLGYMLIEIILIQRFIIYFGSPVISVSWVIAVMMVSSGAGSYFGGKFEASKNNLLYILMIILFCCSAILFGLNPLINASTGLPTSYKIIIALIVIALPSFFMGIPFPVALKIISKDNEALIPWAWGINGCFSVIASPLAALLAVEAGYTRVMAIATAAYFLALLFSGKLSARQLTP